MKKIVFLSVLALMLSAVCIQAKTTRQKTSRIKKVETVDLKKCKKVEMKTTLGTIEIALYTFLGSDSAIFYYKKH